MALLYVKIVKRRYANSEGTCIALERISIDGQTFFVIPSDKRVMNASHQQLYNNSTIKAAANSIVPVNGYRNLKIKLSAELKRFYFDDEDNACFDGIYLEEASDTQKTDLNSSSFTTSFTGSLSNNDTIMLQQLREANDVRQQQERIANVEKKFNLIKFNGTQNTVEWLEMFEKECVRYQVDNSRKVDVIKYFLEGSAYDWYHTNLQRLDIEDFALWKASFLAVFVNKGWYSVRKLFNFKYRSGYSLSNFAIKKERLCLEAEKTMTEQSIINMIVAELPDNIQEKLDKQEVKTVNLLHAELRKLDDRYSTKIKNSSITNSDQFIQKQVTKTANSKQQTSYQTNKEKVANGPLKKEPCFLCANLGLDNPPRYHNPAVCNNKEKYAKKLLHINNIIEKETYDEQDDVTRLMQLSLEDKSE